MNVLTIFNSRRLAYCNCNCEHYRMKFYFGIWCHVLQVDGTAVLKTRPFNTTVVKH